MKNKKEEKKNSGPVPMMTIISNIMITDMMVGMLTAPAAPVPAFPLKR